MMAGAPGVADRLNELAHRIGRLRPDWQRPERYFEEREELAQELRRLALEVEPGARPAFPGYREWKCVNREGRS